MQRLKDNVRQQIISIAHTEFIRHGYKGCSMNAIADELNMSVGNIYRYYRSKDELFSAVLQPAIHALELCFEANSRRSVNPDEIFNSPSAVEDISMTLLGIIQPYREELKLLFSESKGTSVESYFEQLLERFYESGQTYLSRIQAEFPSLNLRLHPIFIRLDCLSWSNLLHVISMNPELDEDDIRSLVDTYIRFNQAGWKQIFFKNK